MVSEIIALEKTCTEVKWIRNLLAYLPICVKPFPAIPMLCDNQAAIAISKNKMYNGKSRHVRLRHVIIKQLLESGVISLDHVKSEENLVDPLTKPLNRKLVESTSRGVGLMPIT